VPEGRAAHTQRFWLGLKVEANLHSNLFATAYQAAAKLQPCIAISILEPIKLHRTTNSLPQPVRVQLLHSNFFGTTCQASLQSNFFAAACQAAAFAQQPLWHSLPGFIAEQFLCRSLSGCSFCTATSLAQPARLHCRAISLPQPVRLQIPLA